MINEGISPMFTRTPAADRNPVEPLKAVKPNGNGSLDAPVARLAPQPKRSGPHDAAKFSVISNDLKIIGQDLRIISQGTLQVDGEVEGDVVGGEVIIGELGKVTGTVAAEQVTVRGKIAGAIRAMTVVLQASAEVEGDIHHMSLTIEQGASFDGRCRRPDDANELRPNLTSRAPIRAV
jgi:cytoskeletal protein CcmA (bactofilin family)